MNSRQVLCVVTNPRRAPSIFTAHSQLVAAAPPPNREESFTQSNACHKYVTHCIIDYYILLLSYTLNKSSISNGKHSTRSRYARAAKCRKFRTSNKFYKLIDLEINSFVCCFRSFQVRMAASLRCAAIGVSVFVCESHFTFDSIYFCTLAAVSHRIFFSAHSIIAAIN